MSSTRTLRLVLALVALVVLVVLAGLTLGLTLPAGDGGDVEVADASAPLAPRGVPARPSCASDLPTRGEEATEDRTVKLGLPDPDRFGPATPERAVAEFLAAWHDRAFDRMATWTAPSWRALSPPGADDGRLLGRRYGAFRLRGWTITGERPGGTRAARRYTVEVAHRDLVPRIRRERLQVVVTREAPDGELVTRGGRWGVLPTAEPGTATAGDEGCTDAAA